MKNKWLIQCVLAAALAACGGGDEDSDSDESGGELPAGTNCGVDTYTNYAKAFFDTNCNSCHGAGVFAASGGGFQLDSLDLVKEHQPHVIEHAVNLEPPIMPYLTPGLPKADRDRLQNWYACKTPL